MCCQKNICNILSLRLQKWFLHQNGVEFNHKSKYEAKYNPLVAHSAVQHSDYRAALPRCPHCTGHTGRLISPAAETEECRARVPAN